MDDEQIIQERKEKALNYLKKNYNLVSYAILAFIVFLTVKIRTKNLPILRDITNGAWTLGPDLDPFLFLRWAKHIVANGSLYALDTMRYSPIGYNTKNELLLHPYMMAWFHKLASIFGSESVTQSAAIYPAFMFALTVIAFFLFAKEIFIKSLGAKKANLIALISAFFLTTIPVLLPRTIAGIPEKESAAFLFLFLAFYFFLSSWNSENKKSRYLRAVLAGISTAGMALIWGGYAFIFLTIAPTVFVAFLLGKIDKQRLQTHIIWVISSFLIMYPLSTRYTIHGLLASVNTGPAVAIIIIIFIHLFISKNDKIKEKINSTRLKILPLPLTSTIFAIIFFSILVTLLFGFSFIPTQIRFVTDNLITPATSRLIQTVAENRQPFFTEWSSSFGPVIRGIPLFFWIFFTGSIYLFYSMMKPFRKNEKIILSLSYTLFLFSLIFSRYDGNSVLNGTNFTSLSLYFIGFLVLILPLGFYYFKYYKQEKQHELQEIDFSYILLFMFFLLSIISTRAAVRLIMILAIPASIIVAYFTSDLFFKLRKIKSKNTKSLVLIVAIIVLIGTIFSGYAFYKITNEQAGVYGPSTYTYQWQKAMAWVRENTVTDAVFAHWWDYGYWIQSIGERATVLDGGNAISYWNHFMGRYALTGTDNQKALEFLYAHKTTHFLIDSTDIGKYPAFSKIGSDETYDRSSFIQPILKNPSQTQEKKDSTLQIYPAGFSTDENIIYEFEGKRIFLPGGRSVLGAVVIERDKSDKIISNPIGVFIYQEQQINIPLRYAYEDSLIDFNSGIEAGVFFFPSAAPTDTGVNIDKNGALLYLSNRTVKSQLARLYLYNEDNPNFKLVHSEQDDLVSQLKSFSPEYKSDFIYYNGFRGPIRIWEISYPSDIQLNPEFLERAYPESISEG